MLLKTALDVYARSLKKEWKHDRTKTVGASEIGQCIRRIAFAKQQTPTDQVENYGALIRGDVIENQFWYPALRAEYGDDLLYAGPDQQTFVSDTLSATPDGLLINQPRDLLKEFGIPDMGSNELVVECKSIDPRVDLKKEKMTHRAQTIVQMGLIREHTPYKPNYALITYVDASFFSEINEFVVSYDANQLKYAKDRARVMLTEDPMELQPEGVLAGGGECKHCPFTSVCKNYEKNFPEKSDQLDEEKLDELSQLCQEYKTVVEQVEELEVTQKTLAETIKKFLRANNVKKITGLVTYSLTKGRVSYDTAGLVEAAKKKGIDVTQFERNGEQTERLIVKR